MIICGLFDTSVFLHISYASSYDKPISERMHNKCYLDYRVSENRAHMKEIFTKNIDCISLKVFYAASLTSRQHRAKAEQTKK